MVLVGETALPGFDPSLSDNGYKKLKEIRQIILAKIPKPPLMICGTGSRHRETCSFIGAKLNGVPAKLSPFCGSGDYKAKDGRISLVNGLRVLEHEYLGLKEVTGFNPWTWIEGLPNNTLLCTDEEFMSALNVKSKKGQLYKLNIKNHTCRQVK